MLRSLAIPLLALLFANPASAGPLDPVETTPLPIVGRSPYDIAFAKVECGQPCQAPSCFSGYLLDCIPNCELRPDSAACLLLWGREAANYLICSDGSGTSTRVGVNTGGPTSGCTMIGAPP